jgi:hypothetical protein
MPTLIELVAAVRSAANVVDLVHDDVEATGSAPRIRIETPRSLWRWPMAPSLVTATMLTV